MNHFEKELQELKNKTKIEILKRLHTSLRTGAYDEVFSSELEAYIKQRATVKNLVNKIIKAEQAKADAAIKEFVDLVEIYEDVIAIIDNLHKGA